MSRLLQRSTLLAGLMSATFAPSAFAQDEREDGALEEVVVTARRITENLQETPIAITAISKQTLEDRDVTSIDKIAFLAPSMTTVQTPGTIGTVSNYIRGIGMGELVLGQDAPIAIYIDGVYNGRNNNARFDLVELERAEVLRGPQGTLFGRNTTGGAISLVSRTPSDTFGGEMKVSYGRFDTRALRARIDSGLIGDSGVKLSVAYQHRQNDGVVDNGRQPSRYDPGAMNSDAVWGAVTGEWGGFRAKLTADYNDLRGVPQYFQLRFASADVKTFLALSPTYGGDSYVITPGYQSSTPSIAYAQPEQQVLTKGAALTLEYQINDHFSVKSISSARGFHFNNGSNQVGPSNLRGLFGNTLATATLRTVNGLNELSPREVNQNQTSQELQAIGDLGEVKFVVGGYYFHEDGDENNLSNSVSVRPGGQYAIYSQSRTAYSIKNKSTAAFGQLSWSPGFFDEKLELTGGARYTTDNKTLVQLLSTARTGHKIYHNTSVLASINYKWTDDLMTYARYATGYRSGGFNTRATGNVSFVFTPEKAKTYEAGFKTEAFGHRFRLNGSAYYTEYTDLQVSQFTGNGAGFQQSANAHYKGFELEAQAAPTRGLSITGSLGYVDPKYTDIYFAAPGTGVLTNYAASAHFSQIAKWTAALGAQYSFPASAYGAWAIRADYSYRSSRWYTSTNLSNTNPFGADIVDAGYGLLSARATLSNIPIREGLKAQISVFGDNLTDTVYTAQGIDYGTLNWAGSVFGPRRTWGVEAKVAF
jgi:iron complex outermembrane receptor protein